MPDHPSEISGALNRPYTEQVAFFRRKLGNLVPTQAWDDMLGAAHDDGFMVAGAAKADLLADLGAAVDKAISEGRGIEEFRRDFKSIVRRHGWTGWTGEGSVKGEAWRVKTILSTNSYTSYAAGRRAQLERVNYPFWVYRHGGSLEPRPEHLSWDGWAGPPSHPFWVTHYPPSDWSCSCYVVGARTAAGVRRMGGDPDKKLPVNWQRIDPKTGAPLGIGKGWDYAPGASVAPIVNAMAGKVGSWDYQVAKAFMDELPADRADQLADAYRALPSTADDARRYAQRVFNGTAEGGEDLRPLAPARTLGRLRSDQAARVEDLTGVSVDGYDFSIDVPGIERQRGVEPGDFALLPRLFSQADIVRSAGRSDAGEPLVELQARIGGRTYIAVLAVRAGPLRSLVLETLSAR